MVRRGSTVRVRGLCKSAAHDAFSFGLTGRRTLCSPGAAEVAQLLSEHGSNSTPSPTHADPKAVWQASGATALFIAAFGAAGYATRRDLAPLARYLF